MSSNSYETVSVQTGTKIGTSEEGRIGSKATAPLNVGPIVVCALYFVVTGDDLLPEGDRE